MRQWPENDEPAFFDELVKGVREAIKFAYKVERKNYGLDIPFIGPEAPAPVMGFSGSKRLTAAHLKTSLEDQGRDALAEIIGVAIALGFEQRRRADKQDRVPRAESAKLVLQSIAALLAAFEDGDPKTLPHIRGLLDSLGKSIDSMID